MPFEWIVALRFLREGRMQSVLIIGGVAVGVGVIVFLSALISGLQASIIERTLGSQAHIVLRTPDEVVRPLMHADQTIYVRSLERRPQRIRSIEQWQQVRSQAASIAGVEAVAPLVTGSAFAVRASASKSVGLMGIEPESYQQVIPIANQIAAGKFRVTGSDAVIGIELAKDLGVAVGDKIRLSTAERAEGAMFTVTGLFDFGNRDLNRRWVYVSLRSAQTLLDLVGGVSHIDVRVDDIFAADEIAAELADRTELAADSWMRINQQLMIGLRSQNSSSWMIQFFVIIAVALGIASVLVVSVIQKSREIGILRAMGASTGRVQIVFLLQGAIVGVTGSVLGLLLGTGLAKLFETFATNPDGSPTFPVALTTGLYLAATAVALVTGISAALAPARRAAKLDPVEAIRG